MSNIKGDNIIIQDGSNNRAVQNTNKSRKKFQDNFFLYVFAGVLIIIIAAIILSSIGIKFTLF